LAETAAYVCSVEALIIDVLADLGLPGAGRLPGFPGVWIDPDSSDPRKICAIGVRLSRGRTMHGFALNVDPDMSMFGHIVPCGIADKGVTSLAAEGIDVDMRTVVDAVAARAAERWGTGGHDRADVVWRHRPDDLSPFSRGAGAGRPVRPQEHGAGQPQTAAPEPSTPAAVPVTLSARGTTARRAARLAEAGVTEAVPISDRKPDWMRAPLTHSPEVAQ